ncbi:tRNA (adenine(22)-N(1))-methyltransferase [Paenibacillus segetis]|uniref:tRNA (Adenine(22)-N(1))-methyltransferase n=1 Tax=Paenibacillus segetis TaxID=1325360 RepID=A0ABQ1YIW1_9BACL|nr:class I SAM-dependent methyltransferase [Paenibacillus segetis]GGH26611.1 tRNA (adenine(22)-N(1))-methyltransferase [Paenibacillus segetis]
MKISSRLQQIAERLPEGCRLADIGSDHALLPVSAVKSGKASFAVAGEVSDGPLDAARRQVAEAGEGHRISVRKGNGLEVITAGEVDTVTIAGMGGALIVSILSAGEDKLVGVKRLVLQPNVAEELVRRWLFEHGWFLSEEVILQEDGKIYEILTADAHPDAMQLNEKLYSERTLPGGTVLTKEILLTMGPRLTEEPNEVFFYKWDSELLKLDRIRQSIATSKLESSREKEMEINREYVQLEEALKCLQKVKP